MKVALLSSDSLRHKFIAAALARELELVLILTEEKSPGILDTSGYSAKDAALIEDHFRGRTESEKAFFGEYEQFPKGVPLLQLSHGSINGPEARKAIEEAAPDYLVLFGTSIIQNSLLERFEGRVVNLHLGLSPYYRGSATNLYPYFFNEPECIGATIHLATPEVDKGKILGQFRPGIKEYDTPHDIGNRVILKAGKLLPQVLGNYDSGNLIPLPQKGKGKLCRNKEITAYVLREIYKKFDRDLIPKYLDDKEKRDAAKPLINEPEKL